MRKVVIVAAKRTPIGKVGGALKDVPPEELGALLIRVLLKECSMNPEELDDVIIGNTVGPGGNLARLSLLTAGLPVDIPGVTVDRQCGSGLEAIHQAARLIQAGAGDVYIAGGIESTSLAPWKIEKPAQLYAPFEPNIFTRARFSPDHIGDPEMGEAAENVAREYSITREEQDLFALYSHQKASAAMKKGVFAREIVPVSIQNRKQHLTVHRDECPRQDTSLEKLAALQPVFEENGTVTAGNACPLNDGACMVVMMAEEKAKQLDLQPLLTFVDAVAVGVDPNILGTGPIPAVKRLLERTGYAMEDIDLMEFNEAFASQTLACVQALHIPLEKLNISGGAIALGHPYGASGAILVTRLVSEMCRLQKKRGIATLGIGGGMGLASMYEWRGPVD